MKSFLNLRLAVRLGVAFAFLCLALVVTTLISLSSIGKVDDRAQRLSHNDLGALKALVTVSEDFLASGYRVVKHLYVEDGDLKAEDRTAKEVAGFEAEARESVAKLRPLLQSDAARA